jgi:hypothetical protein
VFFHESLTRSAEIGPAGPLGLRGSRFIWVSLRSDALLEPLALVRPLAPPADVVVERLDVVAERLDVVAGLPLSVHFRCVQEQADVLALQPEPASPLRV